MTRLRTPSLVASATPQPGSVPPLAEARGLTGAVWGKVALAVGLGAAAVALVPRGWEGGSAPPAGALLATGALVGLLMAAALWWALRRDLGFPALVALYAGAFNLLVVLVKFVVAPQGLYEVNEEVELTALFSLDESIGAIAAAALVFCLYAAGYVLVYLLVVRSRGFARRVGVALRGAVTPGRLAVLAATGFLVLAGLGGILVLVVIPLLFLETGVEYLEFVFSSGVSLAVGVGLAAATVFAALAFRAAAASPAAVADAAVLASFFWLGLAFLALYHALWVVYILVLTALWPLRVVVPK